MPVYQYEGQHFDLPEGLSKEQAIAKIEAHLGKSQPTQPAQRQQYPGHMVSAQCFERRFELPDGRCGRLGCDNAVLFTISR